MFCPKCGKINPDTDSLCSGCGANLHEEEKIVPKKSKNGVKIALSLVVVVAIVIVAVLILNGCNPGNIVDDKISF